MCIDADAPPEEEPLADGEAALLEALAAAAVPLSCLARLWNELKLRWDDSSELTEKTIPAPQWLAGVD